MGRKELMDARRRKRHRWAKLEIRRQEVVSLVETLRDNSTSMVRDAVLAFRHEGPQIKAAPIDPTALEVISRQLRSVQSKPASDP